MGKQRKALKGRKTQVSVDPIDLFLQTATRHFGAAQAQLLTDALRQLIGPARANVWIAWLARGGFWASFAVQAIASLHPGQFFARRRLLPAGITAARVDEVWEELIEGLQVGLAAAPAGPVVPAPGAVPAAPTHAPITFAEEAAVFFAELPRVIMAWAADWWPWIVGVVMVSFSLIFIFWAQAQRWATVALTWLAPSVVDQTSVWLDLSLFAGIVAALFVGVGIVRAFATATPGNLFNRGNLVMPVVGTIIAVPVMAMTYALALDFVILAARIVGTPLPIILELVKKTDRWAMLFAAPSFGVLMFFTGIILAVDSLADGIGTRLALALGMGRVNIPLERIGFGIRGFGLAILAGFSLFHLATTRWPSPQQVEDFLFYGLGLMLLSGIILTWGGVQSNPKVRKRLSIGFVAIITLTTLYVWYQGRHAGEIESAAHTAAVSAEANRPWIVSAWHTFTGASFISGALIGTFCIIPALAFFDIFVGKGKTLGEMIAWTIVGVPSVFALAGILWGWMSFLLTYHPHW